jgi:hypothetical protein
VPNSSSTRHIASIRAAALALVLIVYFQGSARSAEVPKLNVSVQSTVNNPLILQIRLILQGDHPVRFARSLLPWESSRSLILAAAELPGGRTIPLSPAFFDDPGPADTSLEPGRAMSGTVNLRERFPELTGRLAESDVIIFWSYQLSGVTTAADREAWSSERTGGWVLLKRTATQSPRGQGGRIGARRERQ